MTTKRLPFVLVGAAALLGAAPCFAQTTPTTCMAGLTLASGQTCLTQVQGGKT